ncbi:MAG: hypothetical protein F9K13_00230 [Candidatus Methylomirabilis oxygeniifera]|uniref:DUF4149 domain-containing protein n=1 Tax=Methylomirabilis oxygeniifera TaxID=671143 RepID=D5MIA3_METO1|nr:MAG: hypothetical protein F9K13_00230 [Candidatus Methylomirabilis oxyfera]CBE67253.1 membrane protein of unknown function [Candidatus Methylomirabilis oxyfera]
MRALLIMTLGGWIVGTVLMAFVATQNFRTVDRLLSAPTPKFSHALTPIGHDEARVVLRYLVSELNRLYFSAWGLTQLALGVAVVIAAIGLRPLDRTMIAVTATILAIVIVSLLLSQSIVSLGRSLDFVPRVMVSEQAARFRTLHLAYTALDLLKLSLCVWLLIRATRQTYTAVMKR